MTQEDKQLLLKDISARLLYGVKAYDILNDRIYTIEWLNPLNAITSGAGLTTPIEECRPYLRSMLSMTDEELAEYNAAKELDINDSSETLRANWEAKSQVRISKWYHGVDWLNAHHFDYRGLIEKGLALEAPDGMYKTE